MAAQETLPRSGGVFAQEGGNNANAAADRVRSLVRPLPPGHAAYQWKLHRVPPADACAAAEDGMSTLSDRACAILLEMDRRGLLPADDPLLPVVCQTPVSPTIMALVHRAVLMGQPVPKALVEAVIATEQAAGRRRPGGVVVVERFQ
jgi:hypothetical protein